MNSILLKAKETVLSVFSMTPAQRSGCETKLHALVNQGTQVGKQIELADFSSSEASQRWCKNVFSMTSDYIKATKNTFDDLHSADWFFYRFSRWALRTMTGVKTAFGTYLALSEHEVLLLVERIEAIRRTISIEVQSLESQLSQEPSEKVLNWIQDHSLEQMTEKERTLADELVTTLNKMEGVASRLFRWITSQIGMKTSFGALIHRAKTVHTEAKNSYEKVSNWAIATRLELRIHDLEGNLQLLQSQLGHPSLQQVQNLVNELTDVQKEAQILLSLRENAPAKVEQDAIAAWYKKLLKKTNTLWHKITYRVNSDEFDGLVIKPGGINKGWNTCYVAAALQLLSQAAVHGMKEKFAVREVGPDEESSVDQKDRIQANSILKTVNPVIDCILEGNSFTTVNDVTQELFRLGVTHANVGTQACSLEVFENIWNVLNPPSIHIKLTKQPNDAHKVQIGTVPTGTDDARQLENLPSVIGASTQDTSLMLTCPVFGGNKEATSLEEALRLYSRNPEEVPGFQYQDEGILYRSSATDITTLDYNTLPPLLPIGLKRLVLGSNKQKIKHSQPIDVPFVWEVPQDCLCNSDGKPVFYHLIGFIHHWGSGQGGHYMAYLKRRTGWYSVDDATVLEVKDDAVNEARQQGAVYLFERIDLGAEEARRAASSSC